MSEFVAWVISESYGEHSEVVFARNAMEARRLGAVELGGWDSEESYDYRRASEFDGCSSMQELREAQLAAGWWFGCGWADCSEDRCSEDGEDDDGNPLEPAVRDEHVYCNEWHAGAEAVRHVERRIRIWEAVEATCAKFPGAEILTVNDQCRGPNHTDNVWRARVCFRVPGVDYSIDWYVGDTDVFLPEEHVPAFLAYRDARDEAQRLCTVKP